MGIRNAKSITFRPTGVTDSADGTNSFPGSMAQLKNLIAAYGTPNAFVPRPAGTTAVNLTTINANGVVNALLVIGNRVYGMMESTTYTGKDQPFCYDFSVPGFVTIGNLSSALLPASPAHTGDWTPPVMSAVTNSLIMVTHPGFPGASGPYLGWIDISGYSSSAMLAGTTNGSPVLTGVVTTVGSSAPILQGVQPGQAISGTGIPAGAYVVSCTNGAFSLSTTGSTHSNTTLDGLGSTTGVVVGTLVSGPGIPAGTYVQAIVSGTSVTLSQAATATGAGVAITFSGNGTITMSANATATSTSPVSLTVTGGTTAVPRWGAGNLNTNPLSAVPACCAGFNGRAYIGMGPYLVFSDALNPLQVSNASQALVIGDPTSITALASVPLTSQLTGGVQQSLTVFKGAGALTQITGDAATNNLAQNQVAGSVGTLAPNSIAQTPQGTAFMAVDGLRILGLNGVVGDPIGTDGAGVLLPFLNALYPSRMAAAYAEGIYRITVQSTVDPSQPTYEYWVDLKTRDKATWTGPHTCAARLATEYPTAGSFLIAPYAANSVLWQSDVLPRTTSTYTENGAQLSWTYQTSLLPDNQESSFNQIVQTSVALQTHRSDFVSVQFVDDTGASLGSTTVTGIAGAVSYWGSGVWGTFVWGAANSPLREVPVKWTVPLVFRQGQLLVSCAAAQGQMIGNVYAKVKPVGVNVPLM